MCKTISRKAEKLTPLKCMGTQFQNVDLTLVTTMGNSRSTARSRSHSIIKKDEDPLDAGKQIVPIQVVKEVVKGTIKLIVEDSDGRYQLQIQPKAKIQHVKVILLAQYGIPMSPEKQLFYNGDQTEDEKSLVDYNVQSGDSMRILHLDEHDGSPEGGLFDAASRGHLQAVKYLIASGVDVNGVRCASTNKGRRPLHAAAEGGQEEVSRYLLLAGAVVNITDAEGLTPLHLAASRGHDNVLRLLLKEGADVKAKAHGMTMIHFAAAGGHLHLLDQLENVCDITETTDDELTVLHLSAGHGRLEAVLWLVEQGVNFNLRDKRGRTAEDLAREGGHAEVATYLYHWTLLQQRKFLQVVAQGTLVNVVSFFKIGVDIECKTQGEGEWGHRAIHTAALHGHTEIVNALLYVGARREAEDDMGNTAMHYAAAGGQIGTLKLLKNEQCRVSVCNNLNMTPLHFAAAAGELAAASWLLAQGIQANVTSTTGFTATDMAEAQQHYALVDVLRRHQAAQMLRAKPTDVVTIERKLGRGSFGQVYLATMNHRSIVVKKVRFSEENHRDMDLAMQELLLLKHLTHPNIVTYMGSRKQNSHLHIMMEYCSGGDLAQKISQQQTKNEPFEEKLVVTWTCKLTSALQYIHGRKVVHRDLKPANIFLSESGTIKLGDFGLAKVMGESMFVRSYAGAPAYMSPEVLSNIPYNDKADMWSLGCVLYELAALKRVNHNHHHQHHHVDVPGEFSQQFKMLVTSLLNEDFTKRPSSSELARLPFLKIDQSKYEHQQQYQQQLKEVHKDLERPLNDLMRKLLSL